MALAEGRSLNNFFLVTANCITVHSKFYAKFVHMKPPKMGLSRQEINLRRLLAKCELICKTKKEDDRMEKYVDTLEDMFQEVKNLASSNEAVLTYKTRISSLKNNLGITTSKYDIDPEVVRNDLFGVRQRNIVHNETSDADELLKIHENMQQKITQDMLSLTKVLKEQSKTANKIIKQDTEVVSKSTDLAERNFSKLSVESAKLGEHSKRAWKCWMWLMLAVVLIVFINMVLFMKLVKKKY